MNLEYLEQQLQELPLYQYAFLPTQELTFNERVRHICKEECSRYNTTWACPPAVGSVEECKKACLKYPRMLVITTVTEVDDIANLEETLKTRVEHEEITRRVAGLLREQGCEVRGLSTESCAVCTHCAYPDGPCRHPDQMFPCVESQGILTTELYEKLGMEFFNGNIAAWMSLLLYREM